MDIRVNSEEFGLYYLQSRYYDPALGRFISPDSISYLEPESVIGLNLYAYCGDNPVMYYDPNGHSLLAIFLILAATTIAGGVIGAKKAADEGKKGWDFAKNIILVSRLQHNFMDVRKVCFEK